MGPVGPGGRRPAGCRRSQGAGADKTADAVRPSPVSSPRPRPRQRSHPLQGEGRVIPPPERLTLLGVGGETQTIQIRLTYAGGTSGRPGAVARVNVGDVTGEKEGT